MDFRLCYYISHKGSDKHKKNAFFFIFSAPNDQEEHATKKKKKKHGLHRKPLAYSSKIDRLVLTGGNEGYGDNLNDGALPERRE